MLKTNESYDLATLAGEIILLKYLPTLETDMLKTNVIVKISEEGLIEEKRLHDILDNSYTFNGGDGDSQQKHEDWSSYVNILAEKHLPKKIECVIPCIAPKDLKQFKKGLYDFLWDTDLSWYIPADDCFISQERGAWCSTVIIELKIE
jgi:hypothetical protein